jgi:glutamine amidotransferase
MIGPRHKKRRGSLIAIVDYGMGNLRSVWKAFRYLGAEVKLTQSPGDIREAGGIVLPGVGAFRDCMANLDRLGLLDPILGAVRAGKPYLGICLGLQVLFEESEEFGKSHGLGLLQGRVVRFPSDMPAQGQGPRQFLTVPHIGWNSVRLLKRAPHLDGIPEKAHFYFVHSYFGVPADTSIVATTTHYGMDFASSIWKENIFACQFHPEKSQAWGLRILRNFLELEG